nr:MAG TPA: Tail tape measure [Caudoviricetes sp.]
MAQEEIVVKIREDGSVVVSRALKDLAHQSDKAGESVDLTNRRLRGVQASSAEAKRGLDSVSRSTSSAGSSFDRLIRKMRQTMTLLAAIGGTTFSFGAITHGIDAYLNLTNRLKLVSDSQAQLNKLTEEMFRISNMTRMSVEQTSTSFSRFDLALKSVGRSQQETLTITESINKLIAMSGLGAQESAAALLQLSQAFSKGKLDGDEFRTVAETMPLFMDALAKHFGVTRGELLKLRKEGKITTEAMVAALTKSKDEIDSAFSKTNITIGQSLIVVKNKWIEFWGAMESKYAISQKIGNGLMFIANNFHVLENVAVPAMQLLTVWAGVKMVAALRAMSFSTVGIAPVVTVAAGALYLLANSGTDFDKTARRLLIVVVSLSAAFAAWKLATAAAGLAQMAVAAGGLTAALVACRTAAIGAAAATKALLLNPITWGAAAVAVIAAIGVAMATAKSEAEQFEEFMRSMPETIGRVDDKVKQFYNESGTGRTISLKLGVDDSGVIGNSGYLKKLQDIGATAQKVNADMALSSEKTTAAIRANVGKIEATFKDAFDEISKSSNLTAEQRIQHEILTTERKQKLLQDQFEKLDETLSASKAISSQEAEFRKLLEQSVYNESVRLMDLRTKYALEQMRKIRQEAIANASFLDKVMGEGGSLSFNEANKLSRYRMNKESMPEIRSKELELLAQGVKQSKAEELAVASVFSAMSEGVAKGMSDFYSSAEGQKAFKSKSAEEQARLIELMRDHVNKTSDLLKQTPGHYGINEERVELAKMANTLLIMEKNRNKEKVPTPTTNVLREANPSIQFKLKNQSEDVEKAKKAMARKTQTLGNVTADYMIKNAKMLGEKTGECAKYVNNALQAHIKNYRRVGSGKDVAAAAVATGKYKYVPFDDNYVPQVGDIQSLPSWTALGKVHGHSTMYTKDGWVSDFKQKRYGDGRIGTTSQAFYDRIKANPSSIKIARPIDTVTDNSVFNRDYEKVVNDMERFNDKYSEVLDKMRVEREALEAKEPLRMAEAKSLEVIRRLEDSNHKLTQAQVAEIKKEADAYETAAKAKALLDRNNKRVEEIESSKAILIADKARLEVERWINAEREKGLYFTEEVKNKELAATEEHMRELAIQQQINDLWRNKLASIEQAKIQIEAINKLRSEGAIGGAFADRMTTNAQYGIMQANQAAGMTAYGNPMGNSWEEVFGAIDAARFKLLDGYTGTLNDLSAQFGTFFTGLQDGFANSIGAAIVQGKSMKESLMSVAQQGLQSLISGLVKLGIQWAVNAAMAKSINASNVATQNSLMATQATTSALVAAATASAWAPAAAMVSLASYGANAVAADAGILKTTALTKVLAKSSLLGFQTGGYTGNGGVSDIAGVVHGQEYVMDADTTRRIGVRNLDALRNGDVGLSNGASARSGGGKGGIVVNIENYASGVSHEVEQLSENEIRIIAREEAKGVVSREAGRVIAAEISNSNSSVSRAIERNTSATRNRS